MSAIAPGGSNVLDRPRHHCSEGITVHDVHVDCDRDEMHPGWHHGVMTESSESIEIRIEVTWK